MKNARGSATQGTTPAVLIPGGHEQAHKRHGNQTEHDAAEQGFDHGEAGSSGEAQFFHDRGPSRGFIPLTVTGSHSSTADRSPVQGRRGLVTALAALAGLACLVLALVLVLPALHTDPYTRATLERQGSMENGGRLFRLNCAGCHGLAAQGLVGPNLHGVVHRKNDRQLIQQVVSGRTPPMPSFQPEPQAMADLLAFLHSLP